MKKTILTLLFFILAISAYTQNVIIGTNGQVLLESDAGLYREVIPKPIYGEEGIELGMSSEEFSKIHPIDRLTYEYIFEIKLFDHNINVTYETGYDDSVASRKGPIKKITYKFLERVSEKEFHRIYKIVTDSLDGIPINSGYYFPEQLIDFEYTGEFNLNLKEIDFSIVFSADCGKFNFAMDLTDGIISIDYDCSEYYTSLY